MAEITPKISIIMGVYNDEKNIAKAIESILSQTFENFEFIIINDGSKDNSKYIISRYKDSRIVFINQNNQGLTMTLNNAIRIASGEYIARNDSDDYSGPQRLERQLEILESVPKISIVGTSMFLFNDEGVWGHRRAKEYPQKEDFLWGTQFFHPTVMMRKSDVLKVGGYRQSKETRRAEDYDLFVRMYAAGMKGYNIQEPLYCYREDKNAYKKRKYRYRIDEAVLRYKSFKLLGLMPRGIPYIIKPLLVGLIPTKFMMRYRTIKDGKQLK